MQRNRMESACDLDSTPLRPSCRPFTSAPSFLLKHLWALYHPSQPANRVFATPANRQWTDVYAAGMSPVGFVGRGLTSLPTAHLLSKGLSSKCPTWTEWDPAKWPHLRFTPRSTPFPSLPLPLQAPPLTSLLSSSLLLSFSHFVA